MSDDPSGDGEMETNNREAESMACEQITVNILIEKDSVRWSIGPGEWELSDRDRVYLLG
jgi:hypothetical protein